MRVTFVLAYPGMSGGGRVLATYAERLQRRGHRVALVSQPQWQPDLARKLKSLLRGRGWPKAEPEPSWFDGLGVPHRVLERVRPVTDADVPDADVVIATFWTTAHGVAALSPRKGAKAIFVQGYETSPGQENPAIDAVWRLPLHKIVISNWLVAWAKERFGDADVHHVPNSVDTAQFYARPRGRQARPTVGMLYSRFHPKGTDVALSALQRVQERGTQIETTLRPWFTLASAVAVAADAIAILLPGSVVRRADLSKKSSASAALPVSVIFGWLLTGDVVSVLLASVR